MPEGVLPVEKVVEDLESSIDRIDPEEEVVLLLRFFANAQGTGFKVKRMSNYSIRIFFSK